MFHEKSGTNGGLVTALPYICIATGLHDLLAPWCLSYDLLRLGDEDFTL
jgi:hypothetical protein